MKKWMTLAVSVLIFSAFVFAADEPKPQVEGEKRTTASGLTIIETGKSDITAASGDTVWVKYEGRLEGGKKFDASADHIDTRDGISFPLGAGSVIKGWEEGIIGMKLGERRQLIIPPELGYGAKATGPIPANSTLVFDIELVGLKHVDAR